MKTFAEWLQENPEPSLHALLEKHGGYWEIPKEEWLKFQVDKWEWLEKVKQRRG